MNGIAGALMRAGAEGFVSNGNVSEKRKAYMDFVVSLFTFILVVILLSLFGKLLWNNVIVDLFSFAKPAKSIWQILGLMIFVGLIFPCSP
jgi:F0F1-type ATP synthase membrane subunit a